MKKNIFIGLTIISTIIMGSLIFIFTRPSTIITGYIYNHKNGIPLSRKEMNVNSTFTKERKFITDKNGYFEFRVVTGERYNITGKNVKSELTIKKQNKAKVDSIKGYITLGKEINEKQTYAKFKPSVKVIESENNYKVYEAESSVVLGKQYDIRKNDIITLPPTLENIQGLALRVKKVKKNNNSMKLFYSDDLEVKDVLKEAKVNKKVSLKGAYIKTSPQVTFTQLSNYKNNNELISLENKTIKNKTPIFINEVNNKKWEKLDSDVLKLNMDIGLDKFLKRGDGKLKIELKYKPEFQISLDTKKKFAKFDLTNLTSQNIDLNYSIEGNKQYKNLENVRVELGQIILPSYGGFNYPIELYLYSNLSGELKVGAELKQNTKLSAKISNYELSTKIKQDTENKLSFDVKGSEEIGSQQDISVSFLQFKLMSIYSKSPEIELNGEGKLDLLWNNSKPKDSAPLETEIKAARNWKMGVKVDAFDILDWKKKKSLKSKKRQSDEVNIGVEYEKLLSSMTVYDSRKKIKPDGTKSKTNAKSDKKSVTLNYEEKYKNVFDFYGKINNFSKNNGDKTSDEFKELVTNSFEISSWEVESFIEDSANYYYYFIDINKDEKKELIIAKRTNTANTNMFITGIYYLQNNIPKLLAQGFVAGAGGARNSVTILDSGEVYSLSWYSGTGEGQAIKYSFLNGERKIVTSEDISNISEFSIKESYTDLDFQKIKWTKFHFDETIRQIIPNNLQGTWRGTDKYGNTIVMTFYLNGELKTVYYETEETAKITQLKNVTPDSFEYILTDPFDMDATTPGSQVGGVGIKYTTGYKIENGYLIPLIWGSPENEDFDYYKPLEHYKIKLKKDN